MSYNSTQFLRILIDYWLPSLLPSDTSIKSRLLPVLLTYKLVLLTYKLAINWWFPGLPPSVQFSSVAQSCLTLFDPMNSSTPGLPVHHQHPEFTQTHIHRVGDAIQPSHPLSSPSPPAPNPSQHQSLFQ